MSGPLRRALLAACLLSVSFPGRAAAWTEAEVRSASAVVDLREPGDAAVTLEVMIRVRRGWLEGLDLAGFDPELTLSGEAWATDEEGRPYRPVVERRRGGRLAVSFPGRSPRRGQLTLGLSYRTPLAPAEVMDDGTRRRRWTLPGWRSGLDGVEIAVLAPSGARFGPDATDRPASVTRNRTEDDDGVRLIWRRPHLPRTVPWTVAVDLPALVPVRASSDDLARGDAEAPPVDHRFGLAWALVVLLLVVAKVLDQRRRAATLGRRPRPWLPGSSLLRLPLALGLAAAGGLLLGTVSAASLAAFAMLAMLGAQRPWGSGDIAQLGAWESAGPRLLRGASSRWRGLDPLDATTALGVASLAAVLGLFAALAAWLPPTSLGWCLPLALAPLPLFLTGTRHARALTAEETLRTLLAASSTWPDGVALRPMLHRSVRGQVQAARISWVTAARPEGLLRLDLALAERAHVGGVEREPRILVLSRVGSAADERLAEHLDGVPAARPPRGRRVLRTLAFTPVGAARVLAALSTPEATAASVAPLSPVEASSA